MPKTEAKTKTSKETYWLVRNPSGQGLGVMGVPDQGTNVVPASHGTPKQDHHRTLSDANTLGVYSS